jgi:cell shape-determining protein MreD
MRWVAAIVAILAALCDTSAAWAGTGLPVLTLTFLVSWYAIFDFDGVLVAAVAGGLALDLYSGLRFGAFALTFLYTFFIISLIRSRPLGTEGFISTFLVGIGVSALWTAVYLVIETLNFHNVRGNIPAISLLLSSLIVATMSVVLKSIIEAILSAMGYGPAEKVI